MSTYHDPDHGDACEGALQYHTRFGDVCCDRCHNRLGWHPFLVRPGVFGDGTDAWAKDVHRSMLSDGEGNLLIAGLIYHHRFTGGGKYPMAWGVKSDIPVIV